MSRWWIIAADGTCMEPLLQTEDHLVVDTEAGFVRAGQIVAFDDVAHRVVWVDPAGGIWELPDRGVRPRRREVSEVRGVVVAAARGDDWIELDDRCESLLAVAARVLAGRFRGWAGRWRRQIMRRAAHSANS